MKPIVSILSGDRAGERLVLEPNKHYVIGRDLSADICLPEKKISRRHAIIFWDKGTGEISVEDLNSLNGTSINGSAINGTRRLKDGDRVQVGSYLLQLQIPSLEVVASRDHPAQTDKRPKRSASSESPSVSRPSSKVDSDSAPSKHEIVSNALQDFVESISHATESFDETGGRLLQGKLSEIPIADLLQMLSTMRKSGRLILSEDKLLRAPRVADASSSTAFIILNEGDVEYALYGDLENEEAFYAVLEKTDGYFTLFPLDGSSHPSTMTTPIEALLLEGFRRLDEAKAHQGKLGMNDILEVHPDEPLTSLEPEELKVFQTAWKHRVVKEILSHAPVDPSRAEDIVKKLIRSGFLKKQKG